MRMPTETPDLALIEQALAREDPAAARAALLALLETQHDQQSVLTRRVLTQTPFAPDAIAATVDRLLALIRAQEAQIRALQALVQIRL